LCLANTLIEDIVVEDSLLERDDRFGDFDLAQSHLVFQVCDASLKVDLPTGSQHQISVNVEHFDGGIGLVKLLESLDEPWLILNILGLQGGLEQR
jgi:hypothetical protein